MLQDLLIPLFKQLHDQNIMYCVCGNYENLPYETSHDVDIWVENVSEVEAIMKSIAQRVGLKLYLHNRTANGCNIFFAKVNYDRIEFFRIDLLKECAWKSVFPIVKADTISDSLTLYRDFFIAGPEAEAAMHLLYPLLNLKIVKPKYRRKLYSFRNNPHFIKIIRKVLGGSLTNEVVKHIECQDWSAIEGFARKVRLKAMLYGLRTLNSNRLRILLLALKSNICRLLHPSGLTVAFIGPDGCGKSTIMTKLIGDHLGWFIKSKYFYWRPFLLPRIRRLIPFIKERDETNVQQRHLNTKQTTIGLIVSVLKLAYYVLDYVIGRLKYQSSCAKGGLVIFDRYYHDLLVYPERFGLSLSQRIITLFSWLVPKPDLFFYLDVSPRILLRRKEELPLDEMTRQVNAYRDLSAGYLSNVHMIDATMSIDEICRKIKEICINYMAQRNEKGFA